MGGFARAHPDVPVKWHPLADQVSGGVVLAVDSHAQGLSGGGPVAKSWVCAVRGEVSEIRVRGAAAKDGSGKGLAFSMHPIRAQGHGPWWVVRCVIENGTVGLLRTWLAQQGFVVWGDDLFPARPWWHLEEVRWGGKTFRDPVEGEADRELTDLLRGDPAALLCRAVRGRHGLVWRWVQEGQRGPFAVRLVDGRGDGLPDVLVEAYGSHALVSSTPRVPEAQVRVLGDALCGLGFSGVYHGERRARGQRTSGELIAGEAPREPLWVREGDLPLPVRVDGGPHSGLFLDQRDGRREVTRRARGKAVLNLFAHTCSFGAAAVIGGAARVVNVDLSGAALRRGEEALLAVPGAAHADVSFMREDAFLALRRFARSGARFDVVVVDPPTFSRGKGKVWSSGDDWIGLMVLVGQVCSSNAVILAVSNDGRMGRRVFERRLRAGLQRVHGSGVTMRWLGGDGDSRHSRRRAVKSVLVSLAPRRAGRSS